MADDRLPISEAELVERYEAGETMDQLALALGYGSNGIRYRLQKAGAKIRPVPTGRFSTVDPAEIVRMYRAGNTMSAISKTLGASTATVQRALKDAEVAVRPRSSYPTREWERPKIDLPAAAIEQYVAGASLAEVCRVYGVSQAVLDRHLGEAGIKARRAARRPTIVPDEVVTRYEQGESAMALATEFKMATPTVLRAVRRAGIPVRNGVEQAQTPYTREKKARTRQERLTTSSHYEDDLAVVLDRIGEPYVRQAALGGYNVDFLLTDRNLVLEVLGGWECARRSELNAKRQRYFEAAGFQYAEIAPPFEHLLHFGRPAQLQLVDRRTA